MNIKRFCEFKNFIKENQNVKRCIIRCDLNLPSDVFNGVYDPSSSQIGARYHDHFALQTPKNRRYN